LGRHLTDSFIAAGYAVVVNYLHAEVSAKELIKNRGMSEMQSRSGRYFVRRTIILAGLT